MRTTRQQQRAEARVWRQLAEAMAVKKHGHGLCRVLVDISSSKPGRPEHVRVHATIAQAVCDQDRIVWIDDCVSGPDWDRCLFACLMAAVAEAGDMDVYRGEQEYV